MNQTNPASPFACFDKYSVKMAVSSGVKAVLG